MFTGVVVSGRFQFDGFLSEGGFGQVYVVKDLHTNNTLAAKVERLDCRLPLLAKEAECLQELDFFAKNQHKEFFPKFYGAEQTTHFRYMLMELCGRNVRELKKSTVYDRFSIGTSLWIAKKMLQAVEFMHRNGWIHRDIKPPNFCVSLTGARRLILVDFGTAERSQATVKTVGFCGTERYASLRTHQKLSAHQIDDLWAIYYIAVENLNGHLPWRMAGNRDEIAYQKKIVQENAQVIHDLVPHPWFNFVRPPSSMKTFLRLLVEGNFSSAADSPEFYYNALLSEIDRDFMHYNFHEMHSALDWELPMSGIPTTEATYLHPLTPVHGVQSVHLFHHHHHHHQQPQQQQHHHHRDNNNNNMIAADKNAAQFSANLGSFFAASLPPFSP